jgi:hydroxyacylglutathione hydrolase
MAAEEYAKPGDEIRAVRYDADNYAWILAAGSENVIVIDPGSARAVGEALARAHKKPIAFLCTHSDSDHILGLAALAGKFPDACVAAHHEFAGTLPRGAKRCHDNEAVQFGTRRITCLETPGHSGDSMCFLTDTGALFTGDTLFAAGCGRVRGNAYAAMFESLCRIAALPADTRIYPGHDYLEENLRFAMTLPHDAELLGKRRDALAPAARTPSRLRKDSAVHGSALAEEKEPPSTLALELATNPFLRAMDPDFRQSLQSLKSLGAGESAPDVFTMLRVRKNSFI